MPWKREQSNCEQWNGTAWNVWKFGDDKYPWEADCPWENMFNQDEFCKTVEEKWKGRDGTLLTVTTFLLGFYVSTIMGRWWSQVRSLPQIEDVAFVLNTLVVSK